MPANSENSAVATGLEKVSFKERQCQRMLKLSRNCTHASKAMLKILQAGLKQHVNWEVPDVQGGLRKGRGARDQIANIHWIIEKQESSSKASTSALLTIAKAFDIEDLHKLWKLLKEMGVLDYLTCVLRNLYAGQEAPGRIRHGTMDWFQIGKGVC